MTLSRNDILNADDSKHELISVPEWATEDNPKGEVYVRVMDGAGRDKWDFLVVRAYEDNDLGAQQTLRATLAALTLCDADGKLLFNQAEIMALMKRSSVALGRVFEAAKRLNVLGAEDLGELAGNSDGAPSADSGSS